MQAHPRLTGRVVARIQAEGGGAMVNWPRWGKKEDELPSAALPTLSFTEAAHKKLADVLGEGALRISVAGVRQGQPTYQMAVEGSGQPEAGDTVIASQGIRVFVDAESLPYVEGATVDFVDDPLQPGFKVDAPPAFQPKAPAARPHLDTAHPLVQAVQAVIENRVNPGIASHGGRATLIDVQGDTAYVEMGGGCQGCSMASVTLKQGVETMIRQEVPQIRQVIDVTDHAGGSNPYYGSAKGGSSPFHQSSKG